MDDSCLPFAVAAYHAVQLIGLPECTYAEFVNQSLRSFNKEVVGNTIRISPNEILHSYLPRKPVRVETMY